MCINLDVKTVPKNKFTRVWVIKKEKLRKQVASWKITEPFLKMKLYICDQLFKNYIPQ